MQEKLHIKHNTIQETLIIPLYARKLSTEWFPSLFQDQKAVELIERLDYDFSTIETQSRRFMQRFGALEIAMRQYDLAAEVQSYLASHPKAALVNLGCGLDQTGETCDNGTCKIYNVDFPDVIAVRDQLLPAESRVTNIPTDLNHTEWCEQIDASGGVIFFASGVFYYFQTEQMKVLLNHLSQRFPGGTLVFDAAGKKAVKLMLKTWVKKVGIRDVNAFFHVGHVDTDLAPWLHHAKVSSRGYMFGYHDLKDVSLPPFFRLLAKVGDRIMKMQIVRLDFIP